MLKKMVSAALLAIVAVAMVALPSVANTRNYAWEMNHRYVSGDDNGVYHTLTAGSMTFTGTVWPYSTDAGHTTSPYTITTRVYRQAFPSDVVACSASITPWAVINAQRSFSASCGSEPADTYYVQAGTVEDDGWNTRGTGQVATN